MTSLIGRQFGRYTIQEEIGRGGMARVYRARDTQLRRTVALKVLAPQLALDSEFIQRFDREAVIAANLQHPNIVTIYDVGEYEGLRCIAMEYIQGRTLHAVIQERGALGLVYAIPIIAAVASALDYAHTQGAVHRDIKPHNIMLSGDGRILLTDFGIAQAPEARGGERLTRTGIFMGTPEYISPEQASAQRVDGRSDLYSLGITAYEIITGKVPFSGATPQLMLAHLQLPPPPLSSVIADQPPELDLVLARALAKSPDKRYATGAAFVTALREVARSYQVLEADTPALAALAQSGASTQQTVALTTDPPQPAPIPRPPPRQSRAPEQGRQSGLPEQSARPARPTTDQARSNTSQRTTGPMPAILRQSRIIIPIGIGISFVVLFILYAAISGGGPRPITPLIPSPQPSSVRVIPATLRPSVTPSPPATSTPTAIPTPTASMTPTLLPTMFVPTRRPVFVPPTEIPTEFPTEFIPEPTAIPTEAPTEILTEIPTEVPTEIPTDLPTTVVPTTAVPVATTVAPTTAPIATTAVLTATTVVVVPTTAVPTATVGATLTPVPLSATLAAPTATIELPTLTSAVPTATIELPTLTPTVAP